MPKEIVVSHDPRLFDEDGREVPQEQQGVVQVGWQPWPVSHIQVATFARATVTHETLFEGYFVDLDRDGVNELIRHLRKARDKAFGKDE